MSSNTSIKDFTKVLVSTAKTFWAIVAWIWKNPEKLLGGWLAAWISVLAYITMSSGISIALLLFFTSALNFSSMVGLFLPILASVIMFSKEVIPATWKFLEDAFYRIFRKVKKEFEEAFKKIKKLLASIFEKMKELIQKVKDIFKKIAEIPKLK